MAIGKAASPAEVQHVAGFRDPAGNSADHAFLLKDLAVWIGTSVSARVMALSCAAVSVPRAWAAARTRHASTASCAVNALVLATPISGPARVCSYRFALARYAAFLHIDDRKRVRALALEIAQGRERIGCLAGLTDGQAEAARLRRRSAIAKFRCDIDVGGEVGDALQPIPADRAGVYAEPQAVIVTRLIEARSNGSADSDTAPVFGSISCRSVSSIAFGCSKSSFCMKWR